MPTEMPVDLATVRADNNRTGRLLDREAAALDGSVPVNTDRMYLAILDAIGKIPIEERASRGKMATIAAAAARRSLDVEDPALTDATQEIGRLTAALQVCEHTLHLTSPTDADTHAAQVAAGAFRTDWGPVEVYDDLPEFVFVGDAPGGSDLTPAGAAAALASATALPVGTLVNYWRGVRAGEPSGTGRTTHPVEVRGGRVVAWIEGCSGAIALTHVQVVTEHPSEVTG